MKENIKLLDPTFQVQVLSKTERPNLLCYLAMHQDYSGAIRLGQNWV